MEHQDSNGDSVFHLMAAQGFVSLLKENLEKYSKLSLCINNHGHYPIHTSILNNQFPVTQILLTIKGNYLLKDAHEQTPLHYAARYGNAEMVDICIHADNLNTLDTEGKTPLIWAIQSNNLAAAQVLIQRGATSYIIK